MKWFIAGLLLANSALLVWNWGQDGRAVPFSVPRAVDQPADRTGLVLLRELSPLPSAHIELAGNANASVEPVDVVPVSPPIALDEGSVEEGGDTTQLPATVLRCVRLGGYLSQSAMATAAKSLRTAGIDVRRRGEEAVDSSRFWVVLPPYASAAAATPVLDRLERAGIKDYFLVRNGEHKNAISLGLFSGLDAAQRRLRQIRALNLSPKIEERTSPTARWWLEFDWPDDRPDAALRSLLRKAGGGGAPDDCR